MILAEIPTVPPEQLGVFLVCLILLVYFVNQLKRLFGWEDRETVVKGDVNGLKRKVEALSTQVALCVTKSEVKELQKEIEEKYKQLEKYTQDRAHDTINAVNSLQINVEKLRVELIKELASSSQRIENRFNELLLTQAGRSPHTGKSSGGYTK